MTRTSHSRSSILAGRARGFTLVEILVVIGILVLLAAVLVPMITRAMRQAKNTRTAADMQAISTALEAFKADHGDYPRTPDGLYNIGAAYLCRHLNGPLGDGYKQGSGPPAALDDNTDPPDYDGAAQYLPGDVVNVSMTNVFVALVPNTGMPTTDVRTWAQCNDLRDGADGPGLRMRAGGKKYGPYLTGEKMAIKGCSFVDSQGNPILYFPGRGGKSPLNIANSYVNRSSVNPKPTMKWDADDNFYVFQRTNTEPVADILRRIRTAFGDTTGDGGINVNGSTDNETANAPDQPYILWAAGTDGKFGPDIDANPQPPTTWDRLDWDRCDDIVSFRQ